MNVSDIKRVTYTINTVILVLVLGLMAFFYVCNAEILVWFSVPTILVYVIGYVLIAREKLYAYTCMVYFWLTLYMSLTTVCLGTQYGFHLYCLSMIPVIFIADYLAYQLGEKRFNPIFVSVVVAVCFIVSTAYVRMNGSVYKETILTEVFWNINAITVILFLVYYSSLLVKSIIRSEEQLKKNAHEDRLTGLFNRHYMLDVLQKAAEDEPHYYLAMLDIDDFKKINDECGHNAGDLVLSAIADIMRRSCKDETIARWGGEEFLILGLAEARDCRSHMEELRKEVAGTVVTYDDKQIKMTITIGLAEEKRGNSVDKWVQEADDNLYYGKKNGKNKVVG